MNFNSKSVIEKHAYDLLKDGIKNRDSLFHTLVFSNFDGKDISNKVMVLRDFNAAKRTLRFHSDYRSDKAKLIQANSKASVIGYDPNKKIQLRLTGIAKINYKNKKTKEAWNNSQAISKKCYSVLDGSSHKISNPKKYDFHMKDISIEEGYENFCTIEFNFKTLEFLYLQRTGHRRCKFSWDANGKKESCWLVP